MVCFSVEIPKNFDGDEIKSYLNRQGYTRIHKQTKKRLDVIQDRLRVDPTDRSRLVEALEQAFKQGRGQATVHVLTDAQKVASSAQFSAGRHCARCDKRYREPTPSFFSFNSPVGACDSCRGFGRVIGIDFGLVIPDPTKSLADGVIRPWQTEAYKGCQTRPYSTR